MSGAQRWSLQLTSPLGADALWLESLEGGEYISEPFRFELTMLTEQDFVDASALIGKPAHATLVDGNGDKRYIHGIVTRFSQTQRRCTAELRP